MRLSSIIIASLFLTTTLAPVLLAPGARGDASVLMSNTLPTERGYTSAVWDGTYAWVFGGGYGSRCNNCVDPEYSEIVRYNPASNLISIVANLPTARYGTSAAWSGSEAYIFGGFDGTDLDDIVRFTPTTHSVVTMAGTLPAERMFTSAAWVGDYAYIFGGWDCIAPPTQTCAHSNMINYAEILRYDPVTDTVTTMSATLPTGRYDMASAVANGKVYLFGGRQSGAYHDDILEYDPATDILSIIPTKLPYERGEFSAVYDGTHIYVFGGRTNLNNFVDEIIKFDPSSYSVTLMPEKLNRHRTSAVWTGTHAYVFGGRYCGSGNGLCDTIYRYSPTLPATPVATATAGPGEHNITVSWTVNEATLTGFNVYRGSSSGSLSFLASVGGTARSYKDEGLLPLGSQWFYKVEAENAAGLSERSNEVSEFSATYPGAPVNVSASPSFTSTITTTDAYVRVNWTAPSYTGETIIRHYDIYKGSAPGATTFYTRVAATAQEYRDQACTLGQTCYYTVRTNNGVGDSPASPEVSATQIYTDL